jgi:hypothetical protein
MPGSAAAALCGFAAVLWACVATVAAAAARPGYSHRSEFISELGETGTADGLLVSVAGFAPTGLLVLLFLWLARGELPRSRRSTVGILSFAAVGVAYLVAAVARCEPGCPSSGSPAQTVHNFFGALEYVGAFVGLVLSGTVFRRSERWRPLAALSLVCAALVAAGFIGAMLPGLAAFRGTSQRVAEAGIFLWIAAVSVVLLPRPARAH